MSKIIWRPQKNGNGWQYELHEEEGAFAWSAFYLLAELIVAQCKWLKAHGTGYPGSIGASLDSEEEHHIGVALWHDTLDTIIEGFSLLIGEDEKSWEIAMPEKYPDEANKFNAAFDLFREYFFALWD